MALITVFTRNPRVPTGPVSLFFANPFPVSESKAYQDDLKESNKQGDAGNPSCPFLNKVGKLLHTSVLINISRDFVTTTFRNGKSGPVKVLVIVGTAATDVFLDDVENFVLMVIVVGIQD